jgi:hypothetical protein
MLSHLRYIPSSGARDNNVKLSKNMKPDVFCAFRECGGMAPALPEPAEFSIFKVVRKVKNQ